jgi:hypothetical protein
VPVYPLREGANVLLLQPPPSPFRLRQKTTGAALPSPFLAPWRNDRGQRRTVRPYHPPFLAPWRNGRGQRRTVRPYHPSSPRRETAGDNGKRYSPLPSPLPRPQRGRGRGARGEGEGRQARSAAPALTPVPPVPSIRMRASGTHSQHATIA